LFLTDSPPKAKFFRNYNVGGNFGALSNNQHTAQLHSAAHRRRKFSENALFLAIFVHFSSNLVLGIYSLLTDSPPQAKFFRIYTVIRNYPAIWHKQINRQPPPPLGTALHILHSSIMII
jgi:hypothetical protein